jgi:hypothetical protein
VATLLGSWRRAEPILFLAVEPKGWVRRSAIGIVRLEVVRWPDVITDISIDSSASSPRPGRAFRRGREAIEQQEGDQAMTRSIAAIVFLAASATGAGALDLNELAACRLAAAKFCDRSGGMTWSNLLRCGATLAANSQRVGDHCRDVLKRYGQL